MSEGNQMAQFQQHSQHFKSLIDAITNYQFAQIKLYLVNLQKRIQDKTDQFHAQYDSLTSLLNSTKEGKGKVPLHYACAIGHTELVKHMIQIYKADYQIKDKEGNNMFFTSVYHDHIELVQYFVEQLNVSIHSVKQGQISGLHIAAMNNNVEILTYLYQKGGEIQKISIHGKPINMAIGNRSCQTTLKLLQLGADPNGDLTSQYPPPLILSIAFDLPDVYKSLVEHKCNIQLTDPHGYTALHVAAEKGQCSIVQDLISKGLQKFINKEVQGKTPLHLAFQSNKWQVVSILKEHTHRSDEIEKYVKQSAQNVKKIQNEVPLIICEQDKKESQQLKQQGNKYYNQKNYQLALQFYAKACIKNPINDVLERNKAACYLALEKYSQALKCCHRAKQYNPVKNSKTIYRQAKAYVGLKDYIQAAGSLWECLMLQPKNQYFKKEFDICVNLAKKAHKQKNI